MVKSMALLLHRQGYAATGLNQVLEDGAAPRGSLYFHFRGGKRELATAAIAYGAGLTASKIERTLREAHDPVGALDDLAAFFGRRLAESDWELGCALATVALEVAGTDAVLADACSAGFASWIDPIAARLAAAGVAEPEASELATFVLSAWEGALVLARAERSLEPVERTRRHVAAYLRARVG